MGEALALPDADTASLVAVTDWCLSMREWADDCDDIPQALEVLDRLAAFETYLARRGQERPAQEAARWLEVRIGELLGAAVVGRPEGNVSRDEHSLSRVAVHEFRQLAANRDLVADLVPCSRRLILKTIRQWRTPSPPPLPVTAVHPWPERTQPEYTQCKLPFGGEVA